MTFLYPNLLFLLALPIVLLVVDLLRQRRHIATRTHPKILRAQARANSLQTLPNNGTSTAVTRKLRPLFPLAIALAILALARPQYGTIEQPVYEQSHEILIAVDLSNSMLAEDIKPSRLDRARLLITHLLQNLKGERIGLIDFAGTAFLQSPLSSDYEILREFIPILDTKLLPQGGTNYDALLQTAIDAFGNSNASDRFLVILSDGEAHNDTWHRHLQTLKSKNIRVIALGVGTADGATIPQPDGTLLKDNRGAVVLTRLEPSTLRELATSTDGTYADASTWIDIHQLIKTNIETAQRGEHIETRQLHRIDRYQYPLAAALALFLAGLWRDFPTRPHPRKIRLISTATKTSLLLLTLFFLNNPTQAATPPPLLQRPNTTGTSTSNGSPKQPGANVAQTSKSAPSSTQTAGQLPPTPGAAAPSDPSLPIQQVVAQLSSKTGNITAAEYARLAETTLTYGQTLRASKQPIPEAPITDAILATRLGEQLDPKQTDWFKLRSDLYDLLKKPEEEKQPPQNKDDKHEQDKKDQKQDQQQQQQKQDQKSGSDQNQQQQQNDQQQKQDQPQQNQNNDQQDQSKNQQQQSGGDQKNQDQQSGSQDKQQQQNQNQKDDKQQSPNDQSQQQKQGQQQQPDQSQQPGQKTDQQKSDSQQNQNQQPDSQKPAPPPQPTQQDAFGKLDEKNTGQKQQPAPAPSPEQQPQQPEQLQQVGGISTAPQQPDPNQNPALTVPLQKLDQLRDSDSPATLFQRINATTQPPPAQNTQNW